MSEETINSFYRSEPYLIISSPFAVFRISLDGSNYRVLIDNTSCAYCNNVDYHLRYHHNNIDRIYWDNMCAHVFHTHRLNRLFWTDLHSYSINQASLDGSDPTILAANIIPSMSLTKIH